MTIDGSDFTVRPGELVFITGGSLHAECPGTVSISVLFST